MSNWKIKKFDCGCEFPVQYEDGKVVAIDWQPTKFNYNCSRAWELIRQGKTGGLFQLHKPAGRQWSKKIAPDNIEDLAATFAVMRPGATQSIEEDGRSTADHYCDTKHGKEEPHYVHESTKAYLSKTFGYPIFQEGIMNLVKDLAGFTPTEGYALLKACAKKLPEKMLAFEEQFKEGCKKVGKINEEQAETMFEQIKKSARYSFNQSHSLEYAYNSYAFSAIPKAHFPRIAYCTWIDKAKDHEDLAIVINDALEIGLFVRRPDIAFKREDTIICDGELVLGLKNIKSVGKNASKLIELLPENVVGISWIDLLFIFQNVNKRAVESLIKSGALSNLFPDMERSQMLHEFVSLKNFSIKQLEFMSENRYNTLSDTIEYMLSQPVQRGNPCSLEKSHEKACTLYANYMDNYPDKGRDTVRLIAKWEKDLLGKEFSYTEIDSKKLPKDRICCRDLVLDQVQDGRKTNLPIKLTKAYECNQKNGIPMMWLAGFDSSGAFNSIACFGKTYAEPEISQLLYENNVVNIYGEKKDSIFIVESVKQL